MTTALIADDEPVLRASLSRLLGELWPELRIVAQARNGIEAVELARELKPDVCFLDVQMPGLSGIEVARHIGAAAQIVFCTAYDQHAIAAFERGALDYLLKPLDRERLAATVLRLRERLGCAPPASTRYAGRSAPEELHWLRASVGQRVHLIPVTNVLFFRAEDKYTSVYWRSESGEHATAIIRLSLRDLAQQLNPATFVQIHRAILVNLEFVGFIERADNGTASVRLTGCDEILPVSRRYADVFRQM